MPTYKLTYFDVKGLAEGIRLLLSYMGKEFEDIRIPFSLDPNSQWSKMKSELKLAKLPLLEIDGVELTQSTAICRYLADEAGLLGDNAWENLQIDIISGSVKDFAAEMAAMFREQDPDAKAEKMKVFKEKTVPFYFNIFDDTVKNNNGYLANGKLSWVDLWFVGYAESIESVAESPLFDKYTNIKALKDKVYAIPSIKKWIDKRPKTK
uniref:glutathione transferase n=1 Tax=Lygus hesperus TaxID=30085 RepID=A0A146KVM5_LYGHE